MNINILLILALSVVAAVALPVQHVYTSVPPGTYTGVLDAGCSTLDYVVNRTGNLNKALRIVSNGVQHRFLISPWIFNYTNDLRTHESTYTYYYCSASYMSSDILIRTDTSILLPSCWFADSNDMYITITVQNSNISAAYDFSIEFVTDYTIGAPLIPTDSDSRSYNMMFDGLPEAWIGQLDYDIGTLTTGKVLNITWVSYDVKNVKEWFGAKRTSCEPIKLSKNFRSALYSQSSGNNPNRANYVLFPMATESTLTMTSVMAHTTTTWDTTGSMDIKADLLSYTCITDPLPFCGAYVTHPRPSIMMDTLDNDAQATVEMLKTDMSDSCVDMLKALVCMQGIPKCNTNSFIMDICDITCNQAAYDKLLAVWMPCIEGKVRDVQPLDVLELLLQGKDRRAVCTDCYDVFGAIADKIGCGLYEPIANYSNVNCNGHATGAVCTMTCGNGYTGTASPVTCSATGWSAASGCTRAAAGSCGTYNAPLGYINVHCNGTTAGSVCTMSCDSPAYNGTATSVSCNEAGTWSGVSGCSLVDCGVYSVPTGYASPVCSGTLYNKSCSLSCATAYYGNATSVTCQANGVWSDTTGCVPGCGAWTAPAGYIKGDCTGMGYDDTCGVSCNLGYNGPASTITCSTGGSWSAPSFCQPVDCGSYTVYTPGYTNVTCTGSLYGAMCTMSCSEGYYGTPSSIICNYAGAWSAKSGCNVVDCGTYVEPAGYTNSTCTGTAYQDSCQLDCDEANGYTGHETVVTCQGDNTWSTASGCIGVSSASSLIASVLLIILMSLIL